MRGGRRDWARDRELILTYLAGNSIYATAAAFQISPQRVSQILTRYNITKRRRSGAKKRKIAQPTI